MQNRDREVRRQRMTDRVGLIVSHHAKCKRILLRSARLGKQAGHEVPGADVMQQVAEVSIAERKISEVLDVRARPRISSRVFQVLIRCLRKSLPNQRYERTLPGLIDECLMCEDGKSIAARRKNQH